MRPRCSPRRQSWEEERCLGCPEPSSREPPVMLPPPQATPISTGASLSSAPWQDLSPSCAALSSWWGAHVGAKLSVPSWTQLPQGSQDTPPGTVHSDGRAWPPAPGCAPRMRAPGCVPRMCAQEAGRLNPSPALWEGKTETSTCHLQTKIPRIRRVVLDVLSSQ